MKDCSMRWFLILLIALTSFATDRLAAQEAAAEAASAEQSARKRGEQYLRLSSADNNPKQLVAMQTAIVRYQGKPDSKYSGQAVDLVGVVHIGEADYYEDLGDRLSKYDVVLYELVAPDGTRFKPEDLKNRRSILSSMQSGMKEMLNLEYQLEKIDYMSENFRHADMSPDEFAKDMERRGDSIWKMVARMMGAGLASSGSNGGDAGLLLAMVSGNRSKMMKQTMARQLVEMEYITAGMDDKNGENTIIKGRNIKAFKVLREELEKGKKNVAVFYGAGHLMDMADKLETEFDMIEQETTWLNAWDLTSN
jgi:hypothetical protein